MNKPWPWKKIKLSLSSLLFFTMMIVIGYGKTMLQIFCLLSFHELFHIVCAWWLRYDITAIIVYPFGLGMYVEGMEVRHSLEEMAIAMAGLVSYVFSMPILYLLFTHDVISLVNYHWMRDINASILLFNSLPIYPLDGGRVLHGLVHMLVPYGLAKQITLLISCVALLIFSWWNIHGFSMLVVLVAFLCYQLYRSWMQLPLQKRQFYLHRYLYPSTYSLRIHRYLDLFRNHTNIISIKGRYWEEEAWLRAWMQGKHGHKNEDKRSRDIRQQDNKNQPFL